MFTCAYLWELGPKNNEIAVGSLNKNSSNVIGPFYFFPSPEDKVLKIGRILMNAFQWSVLSLL